MPAIPHTISHAKLVFLLATLSIGTSSCIAKPKTLCQSEREPNTPFRYTLCTVSNTAANSQQLKLYWADTSTKQPFFTFANLKNYLDTQGKSLRFAMNAGMYDKDYAPLALYIEGNKQYKSLNTKAGGGNFHLLPNGVFWIDQKGKAHVTETQQYHAASVKPSYATQSGPMLVIDGKLHPKFKKGSTSLKLRNGVGICKDSAGHDTVNFVISDDWVNFYDFATLFKDKLNCKNALFLDGGRASALYSDDVLRHDKKYMGVMIGVTE